MIKHILTAVFCFFGGILVAKEITFNQPGTFQVNELSAALNDNEDVTISFSGGVFSGGNQRIAVSGHAKKIILQGIGVNETVLSGIALDITGAYHLEVKNLCIQNNTSSGKGGSIGILNGAAFLLDNAKIINSTATDGGALAISGTPAVIKNSSITGNNAAKGSAIYVSPSAESDAILSLENSLIANNTASERGAIYIDGVIQGGKQVFLKMTNSTVAFNTSRYAGGIYAKGGENTNLSIVYSTIAYNTSTISPAVNGVSFEGNTILMHNSIISLNGSSAGSTALRDVHVSSAVERNIKNCLIGTTTLTGGGNKIGLYAEIRLANSLEDRGGSTLVLPLLSGSPAIDTGSKIYNLYDTYYINEQPVGIVYYVDGTGKNGLVVSKTEYSGIFASDNTPLGWTTSTTREDAMTKVLSFNKLSQYEVYSWCSECYGNGWYIPTISDYKKLYDAWNGSSSTQMNPEAQAEFNARLEAIGGTGIYPGSILDDSYWTCNADASKNGLQSFKFYDRDSWGADRSWVRNARAVFPFKGSDEDLWTLDFEEDFDGNSLNESVWGRYYSAGHDGHGLRRPSAFSVEDGNVVVTAKMENGSIVSGGMSHKVNYLYGKFEFRVMTDRDPSGIMSGVVLTWPRTEKWPDDGEIDIYETGPGGNRDNFYTFVHYGTIQNHHNPGFRHDSPAREWHIMTYEWTPEYLKFYRDGKLQWTVTDPVAIPKTSHHLCIQLDASKTGTLSQPTKMYVDWVKIYKYNGE